MTSARPIPEGVPSARRSKRYQLPCNALVLRRTINNLGEPYISKKYSYAAYALCAALGCASAAVLADDHGYKQGAVMNVARIRTVNGHFDEYMKWLSTSWKQQEEAAKKAGDIVSYQVVQIEPRTPDDPDLLLMVTYKNWAALDGSRDKQDAILKQVAGSLAAASQAQVERSKIRRVLGSSTMQVLDLK
jgi:hypothetical protein